MFHANASDVGSLAVKDLQVDTLFCTARGVSSINATGKANRLIADVDDISSLSAKYLSVDSAEIRADNIGKVEVRVKNELMVVSMNMSEVLIRGTPKVRKYVDMMSVLKFKN